MPFVDFEVSPKFDPTTSDATEAGKGSILVANVSTGQQNGNGSHMPVEIEVSNVICNCSLPMHIDLRRVALHSRDVTYDRSRGVLYKQKRDPQCYVKVYNSGSIYIAGCRSEDDCRRAARGIGRMVQRSMEKLDSTIRLRDFRISNMLATCRLPFGIKIEEMAKKYPQAVYEPELTVGLTWKSNDPKATLRIHTTGTISITGTTSSSDTIQIIEKIFPLVEEFKCPLRYENKHLSAQRRRHAPPPTTNYLSAPVSKQPRKTAPIYDPACSEFFEGNFADADDELEESEEMFYQENLC
ncbi:TATA box-binding protein-like 1 [Aphelenchoides bicaudatus]|nr:TATA box-binding protein-like 1 [Aphelenchoides bicaudatus]